MRKDQIDWRVTLRRAREARDGGRISQALALFSATIAAAPSIADAYVEAASLIHDVTRGLGGLERLFRRHQRDFGPADTPPPVPAPELTVALDYLLKGIRFAPSTETIYLRLARLLADLGQWQEATACLHKALIGGVDTRAQFLVLGTLLEAVAETELAAECYGRGLQRWPGDAELTCHLARVSVHGGERSLPAHYDRNFLETACQRFGQLPGEIGRLTTAVQASLSRSVRPINAGAHEPHDAALRAARASRTTGAMLAALQDYGRAAWDVSDAARLGRLEYYRDHKLVFHEGVFYAIPAKIDSFEIRDNAVYEIIPPGVFATRIRELTPRWLRPMARYVYRALFGRRRGADRLASQRDVRRRRLTDVAASREYDLILAEIDRRLPLRRQGRDRSRTTPGSEESPQLLQPQASDG